MGGRSYNSEHNSQPGPSHRPVRGSAVIIDDCRLHKLSDPHPTLLKTLAALSQRRELGGCWIQPVFSQDKNSPRPSQASHQAGWINPRRPTHRTTGYCLSPRPTQPCAVIPSPYPTQRPEPGVTTHQTFCIRHRPTYSRQATPSTHDTTHSTQDTANSTLHTTHSTQHPVYNTQAQHPAYNTQHTAPSTLHTTHSTQINPRTCRGGRTDPHGF